MLCFRNISVAHLLLIPFKRSGRGEDLRLNEQPANIKRTLRMHLRIIIIIFQTGACAYKRGVAGPRYNPQWRAHSKENTLRHECQSLSHAL